jgi:cytochrome c oxidase subunit I
MSKEKNAAEVFETEREHDEEDHRAPGTMVLVIILLISFAVYYFANWKALADVWHVR